MSGGSEGHINMQTMEMLGNGQEIAFTVWKEVKISMYCNAIIVQILKGFSPIKY